MLDVDYFDIEENILPYFSKKDYVIVYDWIAELLYIKTKIQFYI